MFWTIFHNDFRRIWREPVMILVPIVLAIIMLLPMRQSVNWSTTRVLQSEARMEFPDSELAMLKTNVQMDQSKKPAFAQYRSVHEQFVKSANSGDRVAFAKFAAKLNGLTQQITGTLYHSDAVYARLAKAGLPVYFSIEQKHMPVLNYLVTSFATSNQSLLILAVLAAVVAYLMVLPHARHEDKLEILAPHTRLLSSLSTGAAVFMSVLVVYMTSLVLTGILPLINAGFGSMKYPINVVHDSSVLSTLTVGDLISGQIMITFAFIVLMVGFSSLLISIWPSLAVNVLVLVGMIVTGATPFIHSATDVPANWLQFIPSSYVWIQDVITGGTSGYQIATLPVVKGVMLLIGYGVVFIGLTLLIRRNRWIR